MHAYGPTPFPGLVGPYAWDRTQNGTCRLCWTIRGRELSVSFSTVPPAPREVLGPQHRLSECPVSECGVRSGDQGISMR